MKAIIRIAGATATSAIAVSPAILALRSGETANFTVTVANKDLTGCGDTTFALDLSGGNINGWLSPSDLRLPPSQTGNSLLTVDTHLSEGNYPLTVFASDADGQEPHHPVNVQSSATLVIDNTPPSTPTGLTGSANKQGRVVLSWQTASDELSGVADYLIYRNNEIIGYAPSNSFTDTTAQSGASYEYAVGARDKAGNISFTSPSILVTTSSKGVGKK